MCGSPRLQEWMEIRILISHSQLRHPSKTGRLTREKQGSWARLSEAYTLNWRCARHPLVRRRQRTVEEEEKVFVAVVLFLNQLTQFLPTSHYQTNTQVKHLNEEFEHLSHFFHFEPEWCNSCSFSLNQTKAGKRNCSICVHVYGSRSDHRSMVGLLVVRRT